MSDPTVDIIIVAKDQLEYTRRCVESIFASTSVPFRILFIDNASVDGTSTYLSDGMSRCPQHGTLEVIQNQENLGWIKGLNQGISRSRAPFVIFSNNDIEVFDGAIDEMIAIAKSNSAIGIVNPNSNEFDIEKKQAGSTQPLQGQVTELIHAAGFFMLVKREVLNRIGGMDEIYSPGYFEEMDYSERARKAGFNIVIARGTYVFHHKSKSFLPADKQKFWDRNEKIFYERWGEDTRFAYVGSSAIIKNAAFRQNLIEFFLTVIREKKSYAYLYLPVGSKKYFEGIHVYFRPAETPCGFRWIAMLLKALRVPKRKRIDVIYVSRPWQATVLGPLLRFFRNLRIELIPDGSQRG